MIDDNKDNYELSDEEKEKMSKLFSELAEYMDKTQPGFKERYDQGITSMKMFEQAVKETDEQHDEWIQIAQKTGMIDELGHILIYFNSVYHATKTGVLDIEFLLSCISHMVKWGFIRGLNYSELRNVPDAFSSFIEDLDID